MQDYLINVISRGLGIRALACTSTNLSNEICSQHKTAPLGTIILSRALAAGALMGGLIDGKQRIGLKFEGTGPLKTVLVESDGQGKIKGFISKPQAELSQENGQLKLGHAIGKAGLLTVTKDLGLKQPYKSTVHLISGLIGDDLAYYFTESEQIPSAVGVSSNLKKDGSVENCGGFLVQALPKEGGKKVNEDAIDTVVERIKEMPRLDSFLNDDKTPEDMIKWIFADIPYEILQKTDLKFSCSCSKNRLQQALATLGKTTIAAMIADDGPTEAVCEYCRRKYNFSKSELQVVYSKL